ncbi:hypothetical protein BOX15_Mlig008668g3, partial [Macrostomum lignano]
CPCKLVHKFLSRAYIILSALGCEIAASARRCSSGSRPCRSYRLRCLLRSFYKPALGTQEFPVAKQQGAAMNYIFPNFRRLGLFLLGILLCLGLVWHLLPSDGRGHRKPARGIQRGLNATPTSSKKASTVDRHRGGRQFPLLDDPSIAASVGSRDQPVIRLVHQSWVNATLPPLFARWAGSFGRCFPTYRYALWTDEDNRRLIAEHYPWFLARFDSYGVGVQKADVSRLFYMYHYGGLYCDLDCECLANFEHMLANTSLAFGAMDGKMIYSSSDSSYVDEGQIENSFMYSRPKHPFFWELIRVLNTTTEGLPIMTSGPYLIMRGIHSARKRGLDKTTFDGLPYLTIYPPHLFNPYSWIRHNAPSCRLFGDFSEESLARCRNSFKTSYVIQYHTQVWDKGKHNVLNRIKF